MKRYFVFLIVMMIPLACDEFAKDGDDEANSEIIILYDDTNLYTGYLITFDASISMNNSKEYKWSYRKKTDNSYNAIDRFEGSASMRIAFIEAGDYSIRLNISEEESRVINITVKDRNIDINTQFIDPAKYTGLFRFCKKNDSPGVYTASLRLNESITKFIKDSDDEYLYFDVCISLEKGNGFLDAFEISGNSEVTTPSDGFALIRGLKSESFPGVIWQREVPATCIRDICTIDHMAAYMTDMIGDQILPDSVLDVKYYYGGGYLVVPDNLPDEFYLMY